MVTKANEKHLIFLQAGNVERVFLDDAVELVQLLKMVVQPDLVLRQLPQ